jgi:hypothetical protein
LAGFAVAPRLVKVSFGLSCITSLCCCRTLDHLRQQNQSRQEQTQQLPLVPAAWSKLCRCGCSMRSTSGHHNKAYKTPSAYLRAGHGKKGYWK